MSTESPTVARLPRLDTVTTAALLVAAGVGWWWSARMAGQMTGMHVGSGMGSARGSMTVSMASFVAAWVAMMGAMMLPAIVPVVGLYRRAASRSRVAPTPWFVAGYLVVWSAIGVPAYFAWRALADPISMGSLWAARLAGGALLAAGCYQLSPLKAVCLRYCRSPMSFFMRQRANLANPLGATRAGVNHGLICLGCCWALMFVLVALGTMQLSWMLALAGFIFVEKVVPGGALIGRIAAVGLVACGVLLLAHPTGLGQLT